MANSNVKALKRPRPLSTMADPSPQRPRPPPRSTGDTSRPPPKKQGMRGGESSPDEEELDLTSQGMESDVSDDEPTKKRKRKHTDPAPKDTYSNDISDSEPSQVDSDDETEDDSDSDSDDGSGDHASLTSLSPIPSHQTANPANPTTTSKSEEQRLRAHLRTLPLGVLAAAQASTALNTHTSNPATRVKQLHPTTTTPTSVHDTPPHSSPPSHRPNPSKPEKQPRNNKHAPPSLPSTRPVRRYRPIVDPSTADPALRARDPRFLSLTTESISSSALRDRYSFLNEYTRSEIATLKSTLSQTKSAAEKDDLRVEINRRENRLRAAAAKEREEGVRRRVKREERQKVASGKKPFFAKRGEIRKMVREEGGKEEKEGEKRAREERREKRVGQKEMRRRPGERRIVERR